MQTDSQQLLSSLMLRIYDVVLEPSSITSVLDEVASGLRAHAASISSMHLQTGLPEAVWASSAVHDIYQGEAGQQAVIAERPFNLMLFEVQNELRFSPDEQLLRQSSSLGYPPISIDEVQEYLRNNYGIHSRLVSSFNKKVADGDVMALHFSSRQAAAQETAITVGPQLLPHVSKAMSVARPFAMLEARYGTVLEVLDRLKLAVFVTGLDGQVWLSNEAAHRVVARGDGLKVDAQGRLVGCGDAARKTLAQAYQQLQQASLGENLLHSKVLLDRSDVHGLRKRAEVYVGECSLLRHGEFGSGANGSGVLMVFADPENAGHVDLDSLAQIYGLSRSEKAVCDLLVKGHSNAEIADIRNVSSDTVASQIKALFSKTSCSRRGELVYLACSFAVPLAEQ